MSPLTVTSARFRYQLLRGLTRSFSLDLPASVSQVHLTSCAVNGLPSCHLTPVRSRNVSAVLSSSRAVADRHAQDAARLLRGRRDRREYRSERPGRHQICLKPPLHQHLPVFRGLYRWLPAPQSYHLTDRNAYPEALHNLDSLLALASLTTKASKAARVTSSRIDMLAGLSKCDSLRTPPCFWASAGPAAIAAITPAPAKGRARAIIPFSPLGRNGEREAVQVVATCRARCLPGDYRRRCY